MSLLVCATPMGTGTGTPTPPQTPTPATLAPRRNGFSDIPSDAFSYNLQQPDNRIPDFVMASDPGNGGNAITYTRDEIYAAVQVRAFPSGQSPLASWRSKLIHFQTRTARLRGAAAYS